MNMMNDSTGDRPVAPTDAPRDEPGARPPALPVGGIWSILPEALELLARNIAARPDIAALVDDPSRPGIAPMRRAGRSGNIGIVEIAGPMDQRPHPFAHLMGYGPSYVEIGAALDHLATDRTVSAIVLDVDSPGGVVAGVQGLSDRIKASVKPVYVYSGGDLASAAYWLASGAAEIWAAPTAQVGSIGVIATHVDLSGRDERAGIRRTHLTAGRYKAAGSPSGPLDDASRDYLQSRIDQVYAIFRGDVASSRPVDAADAELWADGRVFLAQEALWAGLIDRVSPHLGDLITHVEEKMTDTMTAATLRAQYPGIVQEIRAEAQAELKAASDSAITTAEKSAVNRVLALSRAVLGDETAAKLAALLESGVTPEAIAAIRAAGLLTPPAAAPAPVPSAPDTQAQVLAALRAATPGPIPAVAGPLSGAPGSGDLVAVFDGLVLAEMGKGKSRAIAIRDAGISNPDAKAAWLTAQQKGGAR